MLAAECAHLRLARRIADCHGARGCLRKEEMSGSTLVLSSPFHAEMLPGLGAESTCLLTQPPRWIFQKAAAQKSSGVDPNLDGWYAARDGTLQTNLKAVKLRVFE